MRKPKVGAIVRLTVTAVRVVGVKNADLCTGRLEAISTSAVPGDPGIGSVYWADNAPLPERVSMRWLRAVAS
jgi:hypothetical protein